jgi:hypothetical protein
MPIQVVALQIQTVTPVSLGGGPVGYYYATLDTSYQNTGLLTIDSFPTAGSPGTFDDYFTVNFDIRFGSLTWPIVAEEVGVNAITLSGSGEWGTANLWPYPPVGPLICISRNGADESHSVTPDLADTFLTGDFLVQTIPEPSGLALLCCGVACLAIRTRRGRK